jgi:FkbM family methyltransferase
LKKTFAEASSKTTCGTREDDLSRQTLVNVLSARINADPIFLRDIVKKNQYFPEGIMQFSEEEIFVDGGAFNGDTFLAFLDVVKGKFARYYAFEPDPKNYKELSEKVCVDEKRVEIFLKGLWSVPALLNFSTGNGSASSLLLSEASDKGSFFQSIQVQVDTIDHLCSDATVIKMDIEGAELEALRGAMKTILRNYPKLAICVYHRPEHLFEIPLFIHSIAPEYHLYLRHHSEVETETVLYAIK